MKQLLLLPAIIALCFSAQAQQENWDTYMARFGARPGSVMVDLGLITSAPDKLLPYLVVTGPRAAICNSKQGIPDTAEITKMESILDLTSAFLSGVTARKLVGTLTYNCERVNYYYVKDTIAVRNAITRMYATNYPNYTYTLKIKKEPLWQTYRTFLYPDSAATSWMANNKIITAMLQNGDNLELPRDIDHTIYFKADSGRSSLITFAKTHGYRVKRIYDAPEVAFPYELTIARHSRVVMDSIIAMESELRTAAKPLQGYYKGWEAPRK